jgi:hypothetical protein
MEKHIFKSTAEVGLEGWLAPLEHALSAKDFGE